MIVEMSYEGIFYEIISYEFYEAQFPKFNAFNGQMSIFRRYCIQNFKDEIQIQLYNINNESVSHFSQRISVKGKRILRKSQAQFLEKLRKLKLGQIDDFLLKETCDLN